MDKKFKDSRGKHPAKTDYKDRTQYGKNKNRKVKAGRSWLLTIFMCMLILAVFGTTVTVITGVMAYRRMSRDLPRITRLEDYQPPVITSVYSLNGEKIAEFYKERRILIPLSQMPKMLIAAFVSAEDSRFYQHKGVDIISIGRAFIKNIKAGAIIQGGSTITQQVARSFFLSPEKNYERKIKEAILAYRIDKHFTKDEILYLYLNQIYLGDGAYGVEAAAQNYFDKSAKDLNLAECAMLAGLPRAPSAYSPFNHFEKAKEKQIYVLQRMAAEGYITQMQLTQAINLPLDVHPRRNWFKESVPYYAEHVRRMVLEKYGADALYTGGLQIYTAVDADMQEAARQAIDVGLRELDKRQGYRGPLRRLAQEEYEAFSRDIKERLSEKPLAPGDRTEALVIRVDDRKKLVTVRIGDIQGELHLKDMAWARKPNPKVSYKYAKIDRPSKALAVGDVILVGIKEKIKDSDSYLVSLEQDPDAQSAIMCIEAGTGLIKAMVGGRNYQESQFNRAVQSRRQPGSSFKPIIYAAALDKVDENGKNMFTPATIIIDNALIFQDGANNKKWKPKNYDRKFYGPTRFRVALAKSRNLATIKILSEIGIDYTISYARKLGITSNLQNDLSIALGSSGLSLLEMVRAYSVFANGGNLIEPAFITKIVDRNGKILEQYDPEPKPAIESSTAYIMTSLLESVVNEGTGRRVKALGRPTAGKTGTSNSQHDAWFMGYTPRYVTGVWVGFDKERSLGRSEAGSHAAAPIWLEFMKTILKDKPVQTFTVPESVVFSKIDPDTGLLPLPGIGETIFECFKKGTVPTEYAKREDSVKSRETFYKSDL